MPTNWKSYDSAVRLLSAIIAADPSRKLDYAEIAKCFGSDATKDGVEYQFRRIKKDSQRQRECLNNGGDPKTLDIGGGAKSKGGAISGEFGQGTTAKAINMRMQHIKKDPAWDLSINRNAGEMSTPVKATPRKRAAKGSASKAKNGKGLSGSGVDENDDDEGSDFATPSKKKGALNKVKNGRVGKSKGHGASQSFGPDDEYEDMGGAVKFEGGDDYEDGNDMGDMSFDYDSTKHQYYDVDDDDQA